MDNEGAKKGLRDSRSNESDFVVCYAIICHHNATLTEVEWILTYSDADGHYLYRTNMLWRQTMLSQSISFSCSHKTWAMIIDDPHWFIFAHKCFVVLCWGDSLRVMSVNNDKNSFLIKIVVCHKIEFFKGFFFVLEKLQIRSPLKNDMIWCVCEN